jgi:hypothetical protein
MPLYDYRFEMVIDPLKLFFNAIISNAGIVHCGIIIFNQLIQIMPPFAFHTIGFTVSSRKISIHTRSLLLLVIPFGFIDRKLINFGSAGQ